MMAATARPTSSHGHHVVPELSPAGAVVVAGTPVGGAAVVAGASVRDGAVAGASVRDGPVAGASVRDGPVGGASVAGGCVVGLPPAGAVVGTWVGRVTPDGTVTDPPPELEHDAPRSATATASTASRGVSERIATSSPMRFGPVGAVGTVQAAHFVTCRA